MPLDPKRKNGLGGSDLAILMGACPPSWGDARTIWLSKKGMLVKEENEYMHNGHLLEPAIASAFLEHMNKEHGLVDPHHILYNEFVSLEDLPICGTLDMLAWTGVGTEERMFGSEFKSTSVTEDWGEPEGGDIPLRVLIQVHTYMLLTALDSWEVYVLFGDRGFKFAHYHIERDNELIEKIKLTAILFWDRYMDGDDEPESGTYIPFVPPSGESDATPELVEAMSRAISLKTMIQTDGATVSQAEKELKEVNERIKSLLGDKRSVTYGGWKADWNRREESVQDRDAMYLALKEKYILANGEEGARFVDALEAAHTKKSLWQRFTLSPIKESK